MGASQIPCFMTIIDNLNRRMGEHLGFPNGNDPAYKWMEARDLQYYFRNEAHEDWQRRSWADRLGNVWLLCRWTPPIVYMMGVPCELTRLQWSEMFGWSRPFPEKGEYKPLAETALKPGVIPDGRMTDFYICSIQRQLEQVERAHKAELAGRKDETTESCEREAQANMDGWEKQFMDSVADWEPMSWKLGEPRDAGDNDGPVRYQAGVGDSPVSAKVGAV